MVWTPEAVKNLRIHLRLSQAGLAVRLQVVPMTVFRWERGLAKPAEQARRDLDALAKEVRFSS